MPAKYVVRNFVENSYYHVFNRGVEKRKMFLDEQDYSMLFYYMFVYLSPVKNLISKYPNLPFRLQGKNLNKDVELLAYCLMPNHFHFLLKQNSKDGVSKLLKQLTNAYTLYFNQKYERVGGLVQGRFKAVEVPTDELLLHISRYIHLNPVVAEIVSNPKDYKWSSYKNYIGNDKSFIEKMSVLSYFPSAKAYEQFVLNQIEYANELDKIKHLTLED